MSKEKQNTPTNTPTQNQFTNCELEQIEEMAVIVSNSIKQWANELPPISNPHFVANAIYNAGYCKQSKGEWGFDGMSWTCSECGEYATKGIKTNFCPNCGAKMKGGE